MELKEAFDIANQGSWDEEELDIYEHIIFEEHATKNSLKHEYSKGKEDGIQQMSSKVQEAKAEKQKAEAERQKAEAERQEEAKARIKAELEKEKAEAEKQKAELEKQRVEAEKQRVEAEKQKMIELLRAAGISDEDIQAKLNNN
jgi:hypothetical protein